MRRRLSLGVLFLALGPTLGAVELRIKGSDTINGALAPDWAAAFKQRNPEVTVLVEALGSSTAFVGLLDGSADIGTSSRPVSPRELEEFRARGLLLREFLIGYDGVAVIVHPANPVATLTVAEIAGLFTGKIQRWNQVGGENRPVRRISRPTYSGTYAFFKEKVLNSVDPQASFAPDTQYLEDNRDILTLVAQDPGAIAYVGMGWLDPRVKALAVAVSAAQPAVKPEPATVRTGHYPLYRPLLAYTVGDPQGVVRDFLLFAFSAEGQNLVRSHGFVPAEVPPILVADGKKGDSRAPRVFRVTFGPGSAGLSAEARKLLAEVAQELRQTGSKAIVVGHSDAAGSPSANRATAEARARNVAAYLRSLGVPSWALVVKHRGAEEPVASNETPEGRAANRRVDITLVPAEAPIRP